MILMYHNIAREEGFNTISTNNLEEQIQYLISNSEFQIVSLNDYVENMRLHKQKKVISITFDDAYKSIKSEVLPLIQKYDIPITVFVPVGLVGEYNIWDAKRGEKRIDILNWDDMRELKKENLISFESHGLNHISLGAVDIDTFEQELKESKSILENELGIIVHYFSYPFGQMKDVSKKSHLLLKQFGYKAGFSTNWNRKNKIKDLYLLNRIEIQPSDNLNNFRRILTRKIDFKYYKQKLKNILFRLKLCK